MKTKLAVHIISIMMLNLVIFLNYLGIWISRREERERGTLTEHISYWFWYKMSENIHTNNLTRNYNP